MPCFAALRTRRGLTIEPFNDHSMICGFSTCWGDESGFHQTSPWLSSWVRVNKSGGRVLSERSFCDEHEVKQSMERRQCKTILRNFSFALITNPIPSRSWMVGMSEHPAGLQCRHQGEMTILDLKCTKGFSSDLGSNNLTSQSIRSFVNRKYWCPGATQLVAEPSPWPGDYMVVSR